MTEPAWQPQAAIVVGAGSGIGRAVAEEFAARGMDVLALCRRPERFDASPARGRLHVRRCDVTVADELRAALPPIAAGTVVVHSAGVAGPIAPIWECDESAGLQALATMVASAWHTAQLCLSQMVGMNSGLLLLASSGAAGKVAAARATYSMAKAAVDQMTRVVGAELALVGSHVGVASLYPGMVDTGMQAAAREAADRLVDTAFAPALASFGAAHAGGLLMDAQTVAQDIADLAGRRPGALNGKTWRLRNREWGAV
ncbi:MAG TPA: SDR family oxidoreductase [Jatrophihabitans sp.]|nr:SDR family oxidoreductase [Jatrophihabitans sp.]